jgi:hypothetical protein
MSSGVNRIVTGAVYGTGALLEVRSVGFRPKAVALKNVDGICTAEWQNTMPDDSMVKIITAGTMTYDVADGVIPLSDGFSIGADTDVNVDGELVHWAAYE